MSDPRPDGVDQCEPGVCEESSLITTDSFEEFSHEINSLPAESVQENPTHLQELEGSLGERTDADEKAREDDQESGSDRSNTARVQDDTVTNYPADGGMSKSSSFSSAKSREFDASTTSLAEATEPGSGGTVAIGTELDSGDYLHDTEFLNRKRHVFILSTAGKPIYSMHGNEDKLATLFGVMQALVSFIQSGNDTIKSIHAAGVKFVFLVKSPLILVAVSRTSHSVQQIQLQLT